MIATFAIPCRDGERHLEALLRSLLAQTRQDFRLLLVDDASTDRSVELARSVCGDRIEVHVNVTALGLASNWNRCVELTETPYLCLAHMDDVYDPSFLERMLARLEARPPAAAVHCRAHALDGAGRTVPSAAESYKARFWRGLEAAPPGEVFRRIFRGNFIICPSMVYRTESLRAVGGFEESLRFAPDWRLAFEFLLRDDELLAEPERLIGYRRHATSATTDATRSFVRYREELDVLDWAAAEGLRRGLLREREARRRDAVRNNLLYDAFLDLERGDREAARAKLDFLRANAPTLAKDPVVRVFEGLMRLGRFGRLGLALGLRARTR